MQVLAKAMVVIILQYISLSNMLYTLSLHNVICQLYLNKPGGKKVFPHSF